MVFGLFAGLDSSQTWSLNNIGVACDRARSPRQPAGSQYPPLLIDRTHRFIRAPSQRTFGSTAELSSVKCISVQRSGPRCIGLCISHHDGVPEIFGQWDPLSKEAPSILYDGSGDPLETITFHYSSATELASFIVDITLGEEDLGHPRTFAWKAGKVRLHHETKHDY